MCGGEAEELENGGAEGKQDVEDIAALGVAAQQIMLSTKVKNETDDSTTMGKMMMIWRAV